MVVSCFRIRNPQPFSIVTLTSVLFPEPTLSRSPIAVLRWWESRRWTYNAIVGGTGLVTLLAVHAILFGTRFLLQPTPWLVSLAYGVAANVCYSFGPAIELTLQRWLGRQTYGLGPALFRHGLVFSVGLTIFPIGLAIVARVVDVLYRIVH